MGSVDIKETVFLGGTCGSSTWRDELVPMLAIDSFNPVVKDWNEEAYFAELEARKNSDWVLYTITPDTNGTYSIAEVLFYSNKRPEKTMLCILRLEDTEVKRDGKSVYDAHQVKALKKIASMVEGNGAAVFTSLEEVADYLNAWN